MLWMILRICADYQGYNNWLADSSFLENIDFRPKRTSMSRESKDADVNLYLIPIAKLDLSSRRQGL